jgi:hypothetical protein
MTKTELFALSLFIDMLNDSDEYGANEEASRLDHIFVDECRLIDECPIDMSRQAGDLNKRRIAMAAVDFVSKAQYHKTPVASLGEAVALRSPALVGELV